jgi:hypothetical protein
LLRSHASLGTWSFPLALRVWSLLVLVQDIPQYGAHFAFAGLSVLRRLSSFFRKRERRKDVETLLQNQTRTTDHKKMSNLPLPLCGRKAKMLSLRCVQKDFLSYTLKTKAQQIPTAHGVPERLGVAF